MIGAMSLPLRRVTLAGVPISLFRASDEEALSVLAAAEQAVAQGDRGVTASLALVVRTLTEEYSDLAAGLWSEVEEAEAAGRSEIDLRIEAPVTLASAVETWLRLLEHLDELRRTGQFEHAETPGEIVSFRRWMVQEISGQMRSEQEPSPFDGHG